MRRITEEVNYCLLFICLVVFATIILRMVFRVKGEDMNRTFVFVVLHYKVVDETEACIESLLKYNSKVIVVCNGENPNVLNLFSEKHVNNSQIEFVFNAQNLGFARGMNAGYLIAKDKYNADFIMMSLLSDIYSYHVFIRNIR